MTPEPSDASQCNTAIAGPIEQKCMRLYDYDTTNLHLIIELLSTELDCIKADMEALKAANSPVA